MSVIFLGLPSHTQRDFTVMAVLTSPAGLEPADMVSSWLKTEEPSDLARILSLSPAHTQWTVSTKGVQCEVDGFALVNHNIQDGGEIRFVSWSHEPIFLDDYTAYPNATISSTNTTGNHLNVDDDIGFPDANYIVPTTTSSLWLTRLGFGPLTVPGGVDLNTDAGMCSIAFTMRRVFVGAGAVSPTSYPTCEIKLYESGTLIRDLGYRAIVNSDERQVVIVTFGLDELTDQTGANIELDLKVYPGTAPSGHSYARLEEVNLFYEPVLSDVVSPAPVDDSGWIAIDDDARYAPGEEPNKTAHYFPAARISSVGGVTVLLRGDNSNHEAPRRAYPVGVDPTVPTGGLLGTRGRPETSPQYMEAGVLVIGEGVTVETAHIPAQPPISVGVEEIEGQTTQGRTYGADLFRFKVTDSFELLVTETNLAILQRQLAWRRGTGAVYVAFRKDSILPNQAFSSGYFRITAMSAPTWAGVDSGENYYVISLTLEERL